MKRDAIRAEVDKTLALLGFKPKQVRWHGASLDLVIGGAFKSMRFEAGMSKRALAWELGRLTGWIEALSDTYTADNPERKPMPKRKPLPKKANGHAPAEGATA